MALAVHSPSSRMVSLEFRIDWGTATRDRTRWPMPRIEPYPLTRIVVIRLQRTAPRSRRRRRLRDKVGRAGLRFLSLGCLVGISRVRCECPVLGYLR